MILIQEKKCNINAFDFFQYLSLLLLIIYNGAHRASIMLTRNHKLYNEILVDRVILVSNKIFGMMNDISIRKFGITVAFVIKLTSNETNK